MKKKPCRDGNVFMFRRLFLVRGVRIAKKVKRENLDRISNLPDAILSDIMSFLSTREAVGTSVLSTRWRNLFSTVPNIDFNLFEELQRLHYKDHNVIDRWGNWSDSDAESFRSFLDRMMFDNKTNMDKFRLKGKMKVDSNRFSEWISAAVHRGVKHLDLGIHPDREFTTLPGVLFTCSALMTLKLDIVDHPMKLDVPSGFHCPNLKTLHLKLVEFLDDDSIKNLLSGCCSLEDLVIDLCIMSLGNFNISHNLLKRLTIHGLHYRSHSLLMIDTPNLAFFKYSDRLKAGNLLENLPSLVEADINVFEVNDLQADPTTFFRRICNVDSLILSSTSLKILLSCQPLPVFATLEQLEIRYNPYSCCRYNHWQRGFETLLTSSPLLERLSFYQEFLRSLPKNPPMLLFKLKVIEISNFYDKDCIGKVECILKNCKALEKLTIRIAPYVAEEIKLEISQMLLASPRKSKQCCILVV